MNETEDTPVEKLDASQQQPSPFKLAGGSGEMREVLGLSLREATEADAPMIAQLETQCYQGGDLILGQEFLANALRKGDEWRRQLQSERRRAPHSFILYDGKEPVGYFILAPETSEFRDEQQVAWVYDFAVIPERRGFQAARRLFTTLIEESRASGFAIEMEARKGTSHSMLINPKFQKMAHDLGYRVQIKEKPIPGHLQSKEDFYYARLEALPGGD